MNDPKLTRTRISVAERSAIEQYLRHFTSHGQYASMWFRNRDEVSYPATSLLIVVEDIIYQAIIDVIGEYRASEVSSKQILSFVPVVKQAIASFRSSYPEIPVKIRVWRSGESE